MKAKLSCGPGSGAGAPASGITSARIVQLLHRRKQYEEELAIMGRDPKIVRTVMRPGPSFRGGSLKQHVLNSAGAIDLIDRLLALDKIKLPKPTDWWTVGRPE